MADGKMAVHFGSATDMWATPQHVFDEWDGKFGFETDVCAVPENAKCGIFYTPEMDGLKQDWRGVCWMNPPYGRKIGLWVAKAHESSIKNGATVVCLLPARTDTRWWHDHCQHGEIFFLRGRLRFGEAKDNAPFPSAVVIFRPAEQQHAERREMQETEQRLRAEIARLQALASRAVPDGWRLVPVEPTKAMWVAVNKLDDEMAAGGYDGKGCTIEQAWHCLLDAAPQPAAPVQDCPSRAGI